MSPSESARRSPAERLFLLVFHPAVVLAYVVCKYPEWLPGLNGDLLRLNVFGKRPAFWYATLYTLVVAGTCLWVLISGRNRYQRSRKKEPLSRYQRGKFVSILVSQVVCFYVVPFVIPDLSQPGGFFNDPPKIGSKAAHVYVYPAFQSAGLAVYVFVVIPLSVWFFGKRYCSWFCSCGNLAEAIGVLPWGARWVRMHTPRGETARRLEVLQLWVLGFSVFFGVMLLLDTAGLFIASSLTAALQSVQDLLIDFFFGSIVGLGAYPILGTRIWCRYGCPLARGMQLFGHLTRSRFAVVPNDRCRGLGLCTEACPMGIDVAAFAHRDGKPIEVAFGLSNTPCIGCGGCIDVCPVDALSFRPVSGRLTIIAIADGPRTPDDRQSATDARP